jgi:predicted nuclease of predicted toxin-antitoxin system
VRFLIDMPLSPDLAAWLSEQGHDAVHASQIGLYRASDFDILIRAKHEARILITADLDYPRLLALARSADPSLIVFRDGNWSDTDVIARMGQILPGLSDLEPSILMVDRDRVRRRRLPIDQ